MISLIVSHDSFMCDMTHFMCHMAHDVSTHVYQIYIILLYTYIKKYLGPTQHGRLPFQSSASPLALPFLCVNEPRHTC